jgi:myosin heavy subunit
MRRQSTAIPRFSLFSFQDIITCITAILLLMTFILALELSERKNASPRAKSNIVVQNIREERTQLEKQIEEISRQLSEQTEVLNSGALLDEESLKNDIDKTLDVSSELSKNIKNLSAQQQEVDKQLKDLESRNKERAHEAEEIQKLQEQVENAREKLAEMTTENRVFYNTTPGSNRTPWIIELNKDKYVAAQVGMNRPPESFSTIQDLLKWVGTRSPSQDQFMLLVKPDSIDAYDKVLENLRSKKFVVGVDALTEDETAIDPQKGVAP